MARISINSLLFLWNRNAAKVNSAEKEKKKQCAKKVSKKEKLSSEFVFDKIKSSFLVLLLFPVTAHMIFSQQIPVQ